MRGPVTAPVSFRKIPLYKHANGSKLRSINNAARTCGTAMGSAMYLVSFENAGGVLDTRTVKREEDIKAAVLDLINDAAELFAGDKIIVTEID